MQKNDHKSFVLRSEEPEVLDGESALGPLSLRSRADLGLRLRAWGFRAGV